MPEIVHSEWDSNVTGIGSSGSWSRPRLMLLVWAPTGVCEFELPDSGTVQVGRSASCAIPVSDPSVSRNQAEISISPDGMVLRDLGSRNGTWVNDRRIGTEPLPIRVGDYLRFGNAQAQLQLWSQQSTRTPPRFAEESFVSRLMIEAERCVRFNSFLSVISIEAIESGEGDQKGAPELKPLVREATRPTDVVSGKTPLQIDVLLPECGKKAAGEVAQRIQQSLEAHSIQARLGVATYPGDAPSVENLTVAAQMASQRVTGSGLGVANEATRVLQLGSREILIADPAMVRLFGLVERIAGTSLPVLILGETGSGKEIVAEAIHAMGPRSPNPIVKINCAAVPENLLESELFGYERGAFSGAAAAKIGLLEEASGGTLFLDEIGEMPLSLQAKLLRALEDQTVRRLGSVKDVRIDLRIVAATHQKLESRVKDGTFREDLFYRLNAFTLEVPPLRERPCEIALLAARFIGEECRAAGRAPVSIDPQAEAALSAYRWPGNVRELRNVIRSATVLSESEITPLHLPPDIAKLAPRSDPPIAAPRSAAEPSLKDQVRNVERRRILAALEQTKYNQTQAARILNMPRRTLVSKMANMGIDGARVRRAKNAAGR